MKVNVIARRWLLALCCWCCVSGALAIQPPPACGRGAIEKCRAGEICAPVFNVDDYWHGLASCLRGLRDLWQRQGAGVQVEVGSRRMPLEDLVRRQVIGEIARPVVGLYGAEGKRLEVATVVDPDGRLRQEPVRMALLNDRGVPYNSMGQTDFAYFLAQFAVLARRSGTPSGDQDFQLYSALYRADINTLLAPVDEGGLSSSRDCDLEPAARCTWFHSITRRDRLSEEGATLNQHLHAVRDLALLAVLAEKEGLADRQRYRDASRAGLAQLFLSEGNRGSGRPPNLDDFTSEMKKDGFAFYGYSPRDGSGYYLGSGGRDCNYHLHVLDLLSTALQYNPKFLADRIARDRTLSCHGPLAMMFGNLRDRKMRTANEVDSACPTLMSRAAIDNWLSGQFNQCPLQRK